MSRTSPCSTLRAANAALFLFSSLALTLACTGRVPEPDEPCGPPPDERLRWSAWLDRDDPGGTGDWELMDDFDWEQVGCLVPIAVEATTLSCAPAPLDDPAIQVSPMIGLRCENAPQEFEQPPHEVPPPSCADFQVRFGCAEPDWDAVFGRWVEDIDRRQGTLETWIRVEAAMSPAQPTMTFEEDGVFYLGAVGPDDGPIELRGAWRRQNEYLMLNWTDVEQRPQALALPVGDIRTDVLMLRRRPPPAAEDDLNRRRLSVLTLG